jgi:1,6-anhydro-N-acetylmuramate kinase
MRHTLLVLPRIIVPGRGQTIWHLPPPQHFDGDQIRAHLDNAEISLIAANTRIAFLSSFRVNDMALNGQGCPQQMLKRFCSNPTS